MKNEMIWMCDHQNGIAGIYAGYELQAQPGLKVVLFEHGADVHNRSCPIITQNQRVHLLRLAIIALQQSRRFL